MFKMRFLQNSAQVFQNSIQRKFSRNEVFQFHKTTDTKQNLDLSLAYIPNLSLHQSDKSILNYKENTTLLWLLIPDPRLINYVRIMSNIGNSLNNLKNFQIFRIINTELTNTENILRREWPIFVIETRKKFIEILLSVSHKTTLIIQEINYNITKKFKIIENTNIKGNATIYGYKVKERLNIATIQLINGALKIKQQTTEIQEKLNKTKTAGLSKLEELKEKLPCWQQKISDTLQKLQDSINNKFRK